MDDGTEALRRLAPCWSLAGDNHLLNVLQNTHWRIVTKCNEVNGNLEGMVTALDDASISLQNVNNKFMALSNRQFIESRVYDDDADVATEPPPVKDPPKVATPESELESLKRSLSVLERMHETITILQDSDTDTESEDEMTARTVLKPKDLYADRPLPYIIGSEQWKNKWHAGLLAEDSDSDSSTSKRSRRSEQFSDSDPDSPTHTNPDTLRPPERTDDRTISETSSELPSEQDATSPPLPKQRPSDIAAELARRLGGHPPKLPDPEPEYDPPPTVKMYKPPQPNTGPIFPDEPPPLDSPSSEEDIFAELHRSQPYANTRPVPDLFGKPDLFGEEDEVEEGDIFSDFAKPVTNPSAKRRSPLFGNEPEPEMFTEKTPAETTKDNADDSKGTKKPVGGISLFGTNKGAETIGAAILKRNRLSSASGEESGNDTPEPTKPQTIDSQTNREIKTESEKREKDIFDDLFAKSTKMQNTDKAKPKINIIKDIKSEIKKKNEVKVETAKKVDLFSDNIFDDIDDIFSTSTVKMPEKSNQKSIFEDDDDDDLFSEVAAPIKIKSEPKRSNDNKKSLFDSDDELFAESVNKPKIVERKSKPGDSRETTNSNDINNAPKSIFDDGDDLFSNVKSAQRLQNVNNISDMKNKKEERLNNHVPNPVENKVFKSQSLFDDDDSDDNNLFAKPINASNNLTQNVTAVRDDKMHRKISVPPITSEPEERNDNKIVTKTDNADLVNKISRDKTNLVEKTEQSSINNTSPISVANDMNQNNKQNVVEIPRIEEDSDDFEQDFDYLPPSSEDKSNVNIKINSGNNMVVNINVETETIRDEVKKSNIFDSEDDILSKSSKTPFEITVQAESNEAKIAVCTDLSTKLVSDKLNDDLFKNSSESLEKPLENTPKIETFQKSKQIPDSDLSDDLFLTGSKAPEKSSQITKDVDHSKTAKDTNEKALISNTNPSNDVFDDSFIEPPAFEKPKEPKKSKNINALFDDDSEDEALFFKKNDIITDEVPEDFKTDQEKLFGIFRDEPPEVDLKLDSDEDIFSNKPKPAIPEVDATPKNNSNNKVNSDLTSILNESIISEVSKSHRSDLDEELFTSVASSSSIKRPNNPDKDILKSVISQDSENKLSDDENLFKTIPKTETNVISLPQSDNNEKKNNNNTEDFNENMSDDENLFKSKIGTKTVIAELLKDEIKTSQSLDEDLFKSKSDTKPLNLRTEHLNSQIKSDNKIEAVSSKLSDDEDLFKTLPKNIPSGYENQPTKSLETELPKPKISSEESPKRIGKLKTVGLNINVNALLPGSSPKKQKPTEQPISPTEQPIRPTEQPISPTEQPIRPTEQPISPIEQPTSPTEQSTDTTDNNLGETKLVKTVNFNEDPESGVLDNKLSKERAKIQVKRRPSTRRARKEAARKSGIDFGEDSTDNSSSIDDPPRQADTPIKKSTLTQHNTTETKISHSDNVTTETNIEANTENETRPPNVVKPYGRDIKSKIVYVLNDEDIFDTSNKKYPDLKDTRPQIPDTNTVINTQGQVYDRPDKIDKSKSIIDDKKDDSLKKKSSKSIFDSDSDEELFSGKKKDKSVVKKMEKVPLFSDDDDDYLFGVRSKKISDEPKPHTSQSTAAKEVRKSTELVFDDPLSMLGDDD